MDATEYALTLFTSVFYERRHVILVSCIFRFGEHNYTKKPYYEKGITEGVLLHRTGLKERPLRRALGLMKSHGLLFDIPSSTDRYARVWAVSETAAEALYRRCQLMTQHNALKPCSCGIYATDVDDGKCPVCEHDFTEVTCEDRIDIHLECRLFDAVSAARYGGPVPRLPDPPQPRTQSVSDDDEWEDCVPTTSSAPVDVPEEEDDEVLVQCDGEMISVYDVTQDDVERMTTQEFDEYAATVDALAVDT